MIDNFQRWWRTRSLREQRLLLAMFGLFAIVLAWLLIVRPLNDGLAAARERHGAAAVALAETRSRADAVTALGKTPRAALGGPLDGILSQAATEAGFTVTRIEPAGQNQATLVMQSVRPQAFFGWVGQMEKTRGLIVERLTATTNSDQTLAVQVTLRTRGG